MAKNVKEADYEDMPLEELVATRDKLNDLIAQKADAQKLALREQLAALDALMGKPKPVKVEEPTRSRASPKVTHRGPNGEEWRSRGAKPKWLTALLAQGHSEDEYRVKD